MFLELAGECNTKIPFVIMTSDDTNALTVKLLESNSYFGMEPSQVHILKQVVFYLAISSMYFLVKIYSSVGTKVSFAI